MPPIAAETVEIHGLSNALATEVGVRRGLVLKVEQGPDEGRSVNIGAKRVVVGAGRENDLVLTDHAVSRAHFEVLSTRGGLFVRDLSSTNGTYVGGNRIVEAMVAVGGEVRVGANVLRVIDGGAPTIPPSTRTRFGGLIGESRLMREVFALLELASPSDATILLDGPSGTGKELTARAVHDHSQRAKGPFVVFDCGTTSKELVASALFGHKKGSFTGATTDRAGAFVEAEGGTLFLDELGELPLESQTHLLRALEAREVTPVGGDRSRKINCRVVTATNRDLYSLVDEGRFRLDLLHRIAVVHIRLPSLAARRDDLPALIRGFYEGRGLSPGDVEGPNLERLRAHPFDGNVRELRNVLERSLVLATSDPAFKALTLWLGPSAASEHTDDVATVDIDSEFKVAKEKWLDLFESAYLTPLMEKFSGNITHAALHAGLSRRHLRALLVKHGLKGVDDGTPE